MITLIYGGSGSGKSDFAEEYVCKLPYKDRFYLATMKDSGAEAKVRIKKHRINRQGKGFVTLEHDVDIKNAISIVEEMAKKEDSVILLECLSNLVANEMFKDGEVKPEETCVEKVLSDIKAVADNVSSMVIVTNNIFEDGNSYDDCTKEYMRALGKINRILAGLSDEVYEVVVGIGIRVSRLSNQ